MIVIKKNYKSMSFILNLFNVNFEFILFLFLGLSAARYLISSGLNVVVLEAQDRVGGRTFTQNPINEEPWIDFGASFVGITHSHIKKLCQEFNLKLEPVHSKDPYIHYSKVIIKKFNNFFYLKYYLLLVEDHNIFYFESTLILT